MASRIKISSVKYHDEVVITEKNSKSFRTPVVDGEEKGRGHEARDYDAFPVGYSPYATAFPLDLIPEAEWPERIKEMEAKKSNLSSLLRARSIAPSNQARTNFCWCHAAANAHRVIRFLNNQSNLNLSCASVAAPIKNYRNQGGWSPQAVEYMAEVGICTTEFWPENAIDRRYDTAESKADKALHKITEWYDLQPRNYAQLITCLLLRIPVAVGYNWWSHAVCAVDAVMISAREVGIRIWNSWGTSWSDQGYGILNRAKGNADDAIAPAIVTPSEKIDRLLRDPLAKT